MAARYISVTNDGAGSDPSDASLCSLSPMTGVGAP